jgi:hypothetical protein
LKGTIIEGIPKMVGKVYKVEFDDGRITQIHMAILNNQTKVITGENQG